MADHCTCRSGRDFDGSEFGPCEYCERIDDEARELAALRRDAARWRITKISRPQGPYVRGGYVLIRHDDGYRVGIQPHPVTGSWTINHCIMGDGKTEAEAIGGMFLSLDAYADEGHQLPPEIEAIRSLAALARKEP